MWNITETGLQSLLERLSRHKSYLIEAGTEWCLYSARNNFARPIDRIAANLVKELAGRGHLVARKAGGFELRAAQQAESAMASDRRPIRLPDEHAAAPHFNEAESPLAWLRSRKDKKGRPLISAEQFMAGERLRGDYERSMMGSRVTASWEMRASGPGGGNRAADVSDCALTAREHFHRALDVVGKELSSILVQVCCLAAGIEQAERILDLPQRSGKAVLGLALTGLARHYGFIACERQRTAGQWSLDDYRPAIPSAGDS
jgi:hypothetical protein